MPKQKKAKRVPLSESEVRAIEYVLAVHANWAIEGMRSARAALAIADNTYTRGQLAYWVDVERAIRWIGSHVSLWPITQDSVFESDIHDADRTDPLGGLESSESSAREALDNDESGGRAP